MAEADVYALRVDLAITTAERDGLWEDVAHLERTRADTKAQLAAVTAERDALQERVTDYHDRVRDQDAEIKWLYESWRREKAALAASEAALRACLNMVDGDGAPPDWDAIRAMLPEPLGEPFQKVLDDNRWELYARSNEPRKDGQAATAPSPFPTLDSAAIRGASNQVKAEQATMSAALRDAFLVEPRKDGEK